jgi:nitrate reductase alpha subunit
MAWIKDIFAPKQRSWEDFYRNRWAYDKVVRSTHGVNCTGGCSWNIYVKQGVVTWEMQALDYPRFNKDLPPYEPRGCQRGISYSWYIYSPLRVKYPYMRGKLLDLWRSARKQFPDDPVRAWEWIQEDPERRSAYQVARGKGGFRRVSWSEVNELMAAANLSTVRKYGPDRLIGFSPIPAMSMLSYAAGARFMQLMGGVSLSFYDWYCDLPPASPEIWGEQTDVAESADWFNSRMIAVVGSNVLMTRTPDAHFLVEARHRGTKVVVFAPDFNQTSKVADEWLPIHQGQDGAFWQAVCHVILREYYVERPRAQFLEYVKQYSDAPILVELEKQADDSYLPGRQLRASRIAALQAEENAEWKLLMLDANTGELAMPGGTVGHRWQKQKGQWNLKLEDTRDGRAIEPAMHLDHANGSTVAVRFHDFSDGTNDKSAKRHVPARLVETVDGPRYVTTGLELMLAQFGVNRTGTLPGEWPRSYEADDTFTPAWQEKFTGIKASTLMAFARQWADVALESNGACSIIIGAGANHWYHNNLIYRSCITALILCGCVGKNGGGWNHYVGQEKLVPQASWAPIAFGTDWSAPPRLQNAPSFHYIHTDQWRYDRAFDEVCPVADETHTLAQGHTADKQAQAVRLGWLPCYPQFDKSNFDVVHDAQAAGADNDEDIRLHVVRELKERRLHFAMEDPDNPASFPRILYIWRGNALQSSAKGHEYFLRHYLGTHDNAIAQEVAQDAVHDVVWHRHAPKGKLDLVVDLNFRMDTSALYSDIVLPAATYYEKDDLNSTDMHSFIHPLQAAVPPCWESRRVTGRSSAASPRRPPAWHRKYFPKPVKDIVVTPLLHDTPAEIAQPFVKDWARASASPFRARRCPTSASSSATTPG